MLVYTYTKKKWEEYETKVLFIVLGAKIGIIYSILPTSDLFDLF